MHPACQSCRDELLSSAFPAEAGSTHASACASCAAWRERAARQIAALRELPRREAPFELDGRVVATREAGYRQGRAARALLELGRVSSPVELETAVDAGLGRAASGPIEGAAPLRAPSVLDRLVAEELGDPAKAGARRYLGSLRRQRAPAVLLQRLALELREGRAARPRRRARQAWWAASLAGAAVFLWVARLAVESARGTGQEPFVLPEVRVVDSTEALPSVATSLLGGLLGGALDVREL